MSKVKITLYKSLIGCLDKQIATAHSLGLRKIGDTTVQEKSAVTEGKIRVVSHLVSVEQEG
ncbi:MAG: 50S ribosomal protein L30 [Clostridia bacterium]|nr:50S ribosomal protein L30 [Clostridia bacterium]